MAMDMLDCVGWANRRIAAMGLDQTVCILYCARVALLVDAHGRTLDRQAASDDSGDTARAAQVAIGVLLLRFEWHLRALLEGPPDAD